MKGGGLEMEITKVTLDLVKLGLVAGYLLVIFGLLSLFFPRVLLKLNSWANKFLVNLDKGTFARRIPSGLISLLIGGFILFILYKYL